MAAAEDQPAPPASLKIPSIGVETELEHLAVRDDGALAATGRLRAGGLVLRGPAPARGPAVIVGHVDSRDGPAVFSRLAELRPGDLVEVRAPTAAPFASP